MSYADKSREELINLLKKRDNLKNVEFKQPNHNCSELTGLLRKLGLENNHVFPYLRTSRMGLINYTLLPIKHGTKTDFTEENQQTIEKNIKVWNKFIMSDEAFEISCLNRKGWLKFREMHLVKNLS